MKRIQKCQAGCGNFILLDKPESFRVINRRKCCIACVVKSGQRIIGSASFYPTPINAARFNTICARQVARTFIV